MKGLLTSGALSWCYVCFGGGIGSMEGILWVISVKGVAVAVGMNGWGLS